MRTYLIDDDKNEVIVDLTRTKVHSSELVEFDYSTIEDNKLIDKKTIFVRQLCGQYFVSENNKKWSKISRQDLPSRMLNVDRVFKVYRGYKPSGLSGGNEGELLTQMPGKIVKINTQVGDTVEPGQTLIILEAMKMENEIKCGVAGTVKAVHVKEGDALDQGVLMIEIESN
ncbi:acetyl-CoA carboxylase biotin carboxyl carrier protein subunit [Halobacteriovorax sp. HLS]|uniref:acetyl-CoA carboxylase biotin carboxyl carrier protein subunit n=1 Tax=Halobacteriovorax sp. HLS TaxID=2234000 RepID=UPI000FD7DAB6|nr:acetyl-CoA carboxylase biotin carboxyl carrier protein subunit [Halobacteriovorax sp. HLS]